MRWMSSRFPRAARRSPFQRVRMPCGSWTAERQIALVGGKDGHRFGPLTFSPDGRLLAAGVGRQVNVYNAQSGRVRRECSEPGGGMVAVCLSADGIARGCRRRGSKPLCVGSRWGETGSRAAAWCPRAPVEPQVDALSFDEKSGSLVAFIRREERPGFFERWQNPPPPGITTTNITGSLVVRGLTPDGKTTMLPRDGQVVFQSPLRRTCAAICAVDRARSLGRRVGVLRAGTGPARHSRRLLT